MRKMRTNSSTASSLDPYQNLRKTDISTKPHATPDESDCTSSGGKWNTGFQDTRTSVSFHIATCQATYGHLESKENRQAPPLSLKLSIQSETRRFHSPHKHTLGHRARLSSKNIRMFEIVDPPAGLKVAANSVKMDVQVDNLCKAKLVTRNVALERK